MTDLLFKLCSAIATQEGRAFSNNPGDLRAAPWIENPNIVGGFWLPATRAQGIAGMYHQVALDIARGKTLKQLIEKWAPPNENATATYLANVKTWTGIADENQPLQELLEIMHCPSGKQNLVGIVS